MRKCVPELVWKNYPVTWADAKRMLSHYGWVELCKVGGETYYVQRACPKGYPYVLQVLKCEEKYGLYYEARVEGVHPPQPLA